MSGVAASGSAGRPLWARLITTVLVTVLIGPLLGTILVLLTNAIGAAPDAIVTILQGRSLWVVLFEGYVAGGVPAFICGLSFALCGWLSGRLSIWVPILVALALAFLFKIVFYGVAGVGIVFSVIIHIAPALATWWLVKAFWQRREI
ncbi:hypothetical protein [Taklimakanibacter lacteus]|uniref:hypothetical protein n=1 Tax=Taklimakanibacter lacteus TaxID=2268456 RepID=UPI000E66B08E